MRLHTLSQFEKWKKLWNIWKVCKRLFNEVKYTVEASFSHYWIYHKIKIHFEIWNWSWKAQLFLLLFFKKSVKIFNFSFKYIEIRAGYQGDDYGRWRTNYIFLWYSINLWISIETVEKIKYLDDFFGHFSDWREKTLKMKISLSIYRWKGFCYIKAAALFTWPTTSFWALFRARLKICGLTLTNLTDGSNGSVKLSRRI